MVADSRKSNSEETVKFSLKRTASFVVAASLAKRCRPFENGEFFKELSNDVLKCLGEKSEEIRKIINDIPLSPRTIIRRTEHISAFIFSNIKKRMLNCQFFYTFILLVMCVKMPLHIMNLRFATL